MVQFRSDGAWGTGLATVARADEKILDVWFPILGLGSDGAPAGPGTHVVHEQDVPAEVATGVGEDLNRDVTVVAVQVVLASLSAPPADAADAYLRLHLLSHRLLRPHEANLDGIFGVLENVAWTNYGPVSPSALPEARIRLRSAAGVPLQVTSVDKFPRMTDYVVPSGVRIADADRVRLGAHLAEGTTVMHEGFVNFNAGTLGASMVEGRISAGVVVGDGSDIGGGASIMGTLSGGGKQVISIGSGCLLGANAGLGIPLGNDCVVEAGLYLTAGTRVTLPDGQVSPARDLSGANGLLFRRNSQTGGVEALQRQGSWGGLNAALHAN